MVSGLMTSGQLSLRSRLAAVAAGVAFFVMLISLGDFGHSGEGTPGCGIVHDFVGEKRQFSIFSNKKVREFQVHLPRNYDPNVATPVIVAYHGHASTPEDFERIAQFSDPIINPNMIVVYPRGNEKRWMGPNYADPDINDMEFTIDFIEKVKQDYCVDPTRLYAVGHSGGAGFVTQLACSEYPGGLYAAFAPVSGSAYKDRAGESGCEFFHRRRPIFVTHGTGDPVSPYEGGKGNGGILPNIREWFNRWVRRNHCDPEPQVTHLANGVRDESYTCDGRRGMMRHLVMEGHHHGYPDKGHLKTSNSPVDASTLIVQFFEQHRSD